MSSHLHNHRHAHHHSAAHNIGFALALNGVFTVVELIGGVLTGSIAILADALHDLGDTLALTLAFVLERFADKQGNAEFSYGYRRLSLLSAFITGLILIVGSIAIVVAAVPRLLNPTMPHVGGMFFLALLGVLVNSIAAYKVMRGSTLNERTISWHMLEDVFGWVAVLIGSILMHFWELPIIDPILSILFAGFILFGVSRNFLNTSKLFLQGAPAAVDLEKLLDEVRGLDDVIEVHDAHLWSLDGERHVMTLHVVASCQITPQSYQLLKASVRDVVTNYGKIHITLEIESENETCADSECVNTP